MKGNFKFMEMHLSGVKSSYNLYHGCPLIFAESILEKKEFAVKERDNHWLGNGAYFFVDDYEKAYWWANNSLKLIRKTTSEPIVLYFQTEFSREKISDLDTEKDLKKLNDFINYLNENGVKISKKNSSIKELSEHHYMCCAIDLYVGMEQIDAVKYTFTNTSSRYKVFTHEEFGLEPHGVQMCVFNQEQLNFEDCQKLTCN